MNAATMPNLDGFKTMMRELHGDIERVESEMRAAVAHGSEASVSIAEHIITAGGKRLRPALLLLVSEACGYEGRRRLGIAAALELLHTASLIHDDVVDESYTRRGHPTANALSGNARAVLSGDVLLARSCGLIAEHGDLQMLNVFAAMLRGMADGQILEINATFDADVTRSEYLNVIDGKTAILLSAVCEMGALVADASPSLRQTFSTFGRELGLAFQLREDALDFLDSKSPLGKPTSHDIRQGRITLPLFETLERCHPSERDMIKSLLKQIEATTRELESRSEAVVERDVEPEIETIVSLIERYGGVQKTVDEAREHAQRAVALLNGVPPSRARDGLAHAARFVGERMN